jgi:hypothetical protein
VSTTTPVAPAGPERRRQGSLGGLLPTSAVAREGDTLIAALCVEVHGEGAVVPLLVLSDAPGLLGWDPVKGLSVRDDTGRRYAVQNLAQQAGLGALQTAVWIEPAPPPEARRLLLEVTGLVRTAVARGTGIERPLSGAAWSFAIDLVPQRTAAPVPAEPSTEYPSSRPARVPARTFGAFRDLLPIGQARVSDGLAVCLWSIERYSDRAVLSVGTLVEEPLRVAPLTPGVGRVEVWDDRGMRYRVSPIHGAARPGWSETSLEVSPAIQPSAGTLGVRLSDLPGYGPTTSSRRTLAGPFTFGVAVPGPS